METTIVGTAAKARPCAGFWLIPAPLAWALALATLVCLILIGTTYGTNDVLFFKSYAIKESKDGAMALYREGAPLVEFHQEWVEQMAHPPAMLHVWRLTQSLEERTGVPFRVWFRLATLLAHLSMAYILYRLLGEKEAILFALCPAALMICGFHGNSDPLVVALLLMAVYSVESGKDPKVSGMLFALACSVKVWPLFLLMAFILKMGTWRRRVAFAVTAGAVGILVGLPYTVTIPRVVASAVFGYRSIGGWWGLSGFSPAYARFGTLVAFALILALTVGMWRAGANLYRITGAAISLFLVLTPGFGVQYLEWVLPFCFIFRFPHWAAIYGAFSVFLFSVYTKWSGGFPWYFADAVMPESIQLGLLIFWESSVCWILLILALISIVPGSIGKRNASPGYKMS